MSAKYYRGDESMGGIDSSFPDIVRRSERLSTTVFSTENQAVDHIVDQVVSAIQMHEQQSVGLDFFCEAPLFVLGLTTGKTPLGLYRELVKRYNDGVVSFQNVAVYSLDEFYPISADELQSRNYRIREDFLNHIDILPENIHIPDGAMSESEISKYCSIYDSEARAIDLMVIGVGEDGQLGFNEPGTYVKSHTRLVQLSHNTRKIQSANFLGLQNTPQMAITMGLDTIMHSKRVILMAWGEDKASIVQKVVEGEVTDLVPASNLQQHSNIQVVIDKDAAVLLTREQTPWLIGPCDWTPKTIRKAVLWLCSRVHKPILKLTYNDYIENSLGGLLECVGAYDKLNIDIFNALQHTITGWPGGKPNADDSTRPVPSVPHKKRVVIFSPHPDDDVLFMGGTFIRLVEQGHDVHVAYQTSGNIAVHDDVVLHSLDSAKEIGLGDRYQQIKCVIDSKHKGEPEPEELLRVKGAIRRAEAKAACRSVGLDIETNVHFLNMPFYETGGIKKRELSSLDVELVVELLREMQPHQIYAAGDHSDPHGTHRICMNAILKAFDIVQNEEWFSQCQVWLYRGAWQEWDLSMVDMAVPLSPDELIRKRHAIYRHLSQKEMSLFPDNDKREFWQRVEDRVQNTALLYDKLGMAEYQAIEVFVKM